jgi:hypothetical protein
MVSAIDPHVTITHVLCSVYITPSGITHATKQLPSYNVALCYDYKSTPYMYKTHFCPS